MASLEILGSGGAFSYVETAYLLNGTTLIDCGASVVKNLIKDGRAKDITQVIITHVHQDHCNGIETLVYYRRHVARTGKPLTIFTTQQVANYIALLACSFIEDFEVRVVDVLQDKWVYTYPDVADADVGICLVKTRHSRGEVESFGAIIRGDTGDVAITGDVDDVVDIKAHNFIAVFHDAGWTGIPDREDRVHPSAHDVVKLGQNVLCVHTEADVSYCCARLATSGMLITF